MNLETLQQLASQSAPKIAQSCGYYPNNGRPVIVLTTEDENWLQNINLHEVVAYLHKTHKWPDFDAPLLLVYMPERTDRYNLTKQPNYTLIQIGYDNRAKEFNFALQPGFDNVYVLFLCRALLASLEAAPGLANSPANKKAVA